MCIIHTVNNFEDAKKLIDENPNCIILDVREEEEYATGHVKDAVLFPVDDIDSLVEVIKEIYECHNRYDREKIASDSRARFSPNVIASQLTNVFQKVMCK